MNSEQVQQLIAGFEDGSYPVSKWTHQSHIYMAVWYLRRFPLEEASHRIKSGIKQYNLSKGGKNTPTSGYHETITEFYIRILCRFLVRRSGLSDPDLWSALPEQPFMASDFPFNYYSKDYLMDPKARMAWAEPDLKRLGEEVSQVKRSVNNSK